MGMVAPNPRIGSAYVVFFGKHGDVSRWAQERGVCRQWVYREAAALQNALVEKDQIIAAFRQQVLEFKQEVQQLKEKLARAVVLDEDKQAEVASVAEAEGVSLAVIKTIMEVLLPGGILSIASLGRRTKAAGIQAGKLLRVLDTWSNKQARYVNADEIYVKSPVLMMVEPDSMCWLSGRLSDTITGEEWAKEFGRLPNLQQVTRDGGKGLECGVALVNAKRRQKCKRPVLDQSDHFHALRVGCIGMGKARLRAKQALAAAEAAQKKVTDCQQQGKPASPSCVRARAAWRRAEQAMDTWSEQERQWQQVQEALRLVTPEGELNSRQHAEAVLSQALSALPDTEFSKCKRVLAKEAVLNYLDHVHEKISALPFPEEVKQAAVRQEILRRKPEALQGSSLQAAARRGVLLTCAVILSQFGAVGQQAVTAVRDVFRRAYRASSLVECINSVVRMHQSRHRKVTQSLIDLKRLCWNTHTFRTGRRRKTSPYQRLGVPWPKDLRWWDALKLTPEQLRLKLSTEKPAC